MKTIRKIDDLVPKIHEKENAFTVLQSARSPLEMNLLVFEHQEG
jgi:hypothetical protein